MKKFKDFFEVLEPQAKGEKDFKDMHTKAVIDPGYPHHPDNKKIFSGEIKEEVELDEANYKYDGKVAKISKKDFAKVSKDYKNSTKGKERMMILDPKTQATISVPVQFEEVELDEAVWDDVQKIAKNKSAKKVKFDNGETTMIDAFSASAIVKMMPKLNPQNQEKAKKAMGKSPEMFLKLMNVAFGDKK